MKILWFLAFFILLLNCRKSPVRPISIPSFEKTYGTAGDDYALDGIAYDRHLYITGNSEDRLYLLKVDLDGKQIWERTFTNGQASTGHSIKLLKGGDLLLTGGTKNEDATVMRVDTAGQLLWAKQFGGAKPDVAVDGIELDNGDLIIAAATESYGQGSREIYLVGMDGGGNIHWANTYGAQSLDGPAKLIRKSDSSWWVYGYTVNFGAQGRDIWLLEINATGDSIHSQFVGGDKYEQPGGIIKVPQGFAICAHSSSVEINHSMYGAVLDEKGKPVWERHFGGNQHDGGEAVAINGEGNLYFTGWTSSFGAGGDDIYLVKTNQKGLVLFERTFGGTGSEIPYDVLVSSIWVFIIGSTTSTANGDRDVYLIKFLAWD